MSLAINEDNHQLTEADYLASEKLSPIKREYIGGRLYAMAGAGFNHNCIAMNLSANFRNHLKDTPCATFMADMKLRLGKDYVYPDVLVDYTPLTGDAEYSSSPVIIVEVLSKTTRKTDLTVKLLRYINLPSLQEYVLIEQDITAVQLLRKSKYWLSEYFFLGDTVTFASIGLSLSVAEIYDRVDNADMREFRQQVPSS